MLFTFLIDRELIEVEALTLEAALKAAVSEHPNRAVTLVSARAKEQQEIHPQVTQRDM